MTKSKAESRSGELEPGAAQANHSPAQWTLRCVACRLVAPSVRDTCPTCGSLLEPEYALGEVHLGTPHPDVDPITFARDLLPISSTHSLPTGISVVTPCFPSEAAARYVGAKEVWLKDETKQPTGSTKDRMAVIAVGTMVEQGVKAFVAASTGNSSTSLARAVELEGSLHGYFFCGERFAPNHRFESTDRVSLRVVESDFVQAGVIARAFAAEHGFLAESGFASWARREGLKVAYIEAVSQMPNEPDAVVQAISSGMGMVGAYKGFAEMRALGLMQGTPKAILAQQDTCAPMVAGWRRGALELGDDDVIRDPFGPATAILRGDARQSYPYLRAIADKSGGGIFAASLDEMREARAVLTDEHGINACYASAVALAAARNARRAGVISAADRVLVNVTGTLRAV